MFGIGVLGMIVSITRCAYLFVSPHPPVIRTLQAGATAEMSVGIVISCLPALRQLVVVLGKGSSADEIDKRPRGTVEHRVLRPCGAEALPVERHVGEIHIVVPTGASVDVERYGLW